MSATTRTQDAKNMTTPSARELYEMENPVGPDFNDLLDALREIAGLVDRWDAFNDTRDEIEARARAAIAKAEGW